MAYYNLIIPRQYDLPPLPDNTSDIIWTDPDDVPMFTPLTPEQWEALDHPTYVPRLLVSIWVLFSLATGFLALRLYCKFARLRGAWWDDWLLVAAWICILIESACLTQSTKYGFGRYWFDWSPVPEHGTLMMILVNISGSSSVTAATWSKTSFALTLLRLTDARVRLRWLLWFIIVSMNVFMGLTALFNWIQCTPVEKQWKPLTPGSCWDPKIAPNYNIFSAAYSAFMDLTLAMLPWALIWGLQMKRKEKIGVILAMSCGVFAAVTATVKTTKIKAMESANPGPAVDLYIWGQAESCVTIVAACIPILRVFIRGDSTSAQQCYPTNPTLSLRPGTHQSKAHDNFNTITVTAGQRADSSSSHWEDDERGLTREAGRIMQTREVTVEYQDPWVDQHEMDQLKRSNKSF